MPHVIAFSYKEHDYIDIAPGKKGCVHHEVATGEHIYNNERGYKSYDIFVCQKCGMSRAYPHSQRDEKSMQYINMKGGKKK